MRQGGRCLRSSSSSLLLTLLLFLGHVAGEVIPSSPSPLPSITNLRSPAERKEPSLSSSPRSSLNETLAYETSVFSLRAYGLYGAIPGFFGIKNFNVSIQDLGYVLRRTYIVQNDFAFTASSGDVCAVVFRGTDELLNGDSAFPQPSPDWFGPSGNIQRGSLPLVTLGEKGGKKRKILSSHPPGLIVAYERFLADPHFLNDIRDCLAISARQRLVITGHSRGGGLASIMGIHFSRDEALDYERPGMQDQERDKRKYDLSRLREKMSFFLEIYTYGEPRILRETLFPATSSSSASKVLAMSIKKTRFVIEFDPVPALYPRSIAPFLDFAHWGGTVYLLKREFSDLSLSLRSDSDFPSSPWAALTWLNLLQHLPGMYVLKR